jgi:large subunit ribosomal protein L4e
MFAPTQITRKWNRKTNVNLKRYATASAIAASAVNSLVLAHGHRTTEVPVMPLVIDMQNVQKTKDAIEILKNVKALADVDASNDSRSKRSGKGAMRNRRYVQKLGPMVVYAEGDNVEHGFRGISGVTMEKVECMNLLNLAPGGHMGRFVIWTKKAFEKLDEIYAAKANFHMPTPMIKQTDFTRFFQSEAMLKAHRAKKA